MSENLTDLLYIHLCNASACCVELERTQCNLVTAFLSNPQYFCATGVLGPACLTLAEAEADVLTVASKQGAQEGGPTEAADCGCIHSFDH